MKTNYEQIKNMSLDDMAKYLASSSLVPCDDCQYISAPQYCNKESCINTAKEWLQSESEDEE